MPRWLQLTLLAVVILALFGALEFLASLWAPVGFGGGL
jgi:hypothetical protein